MTESGESAGSRTYVLDTNVLLYDPNAIFKFEEHLVVIPITVIEEIDRFKKDLTETGRNARQFSRFLDKLREEGRNDLKDGVTLPTGGSLRIDLSDSAKVTWPWADDEHRADNLILAVASNLDADPDHPGKVVLVSKDTNMRIKANALGTRAEDYSHGKVRIDELYGGQKELTVEATVIDALYQEGTADFDTTELAPNECLVLRNSDRPTQTTLARVGMEPSRIQLIRRVKEGVWGIFPRNKEQCFALDLLLDDDLKLVSLVGKAGTGKTLLAIAAGLHKSADERIYHRLLVSRPIFPLGRDIGYLPGDIGEKLNPWMKPVYDNVEFILDTRASGRGGKGRGYEELIDQGLLEIEPLTYIRGRSIPHQYLIIDEAQNLTPHEIKTIITRAGEGTKVVLTGDPYQIDNPYVDSTSNGLVFIVEKFRNSEIAGHITLTKGERSALAELAANVL
ncbi:MAG: PhoH family protein [Myxococcota bacterium]|nr:PhoH family protein [Myxococcota bacterium]